MTQNFYSKHRIFSKFIPIPRIKTTPLYTHFVVKLYKIYKCSGKEKLQ